MLEIVSETRSAGITWPQGFEGAAGRAGLKAEGDDVALLLCRERAAAAGMFTTNLVHAPCVDWSRAVVQRGRARAIVCNAGNANACNGPDGVDDNARVAAVAAEVLGSDVPDVAIASTGVIGRRLPVDRICAVLPGMAAAAAKGPEVDAAIAHAILTTDTRPKQIAVEAQSSHWAGPVHFGGVCKGSGMIAPRLGPPHATMLCFLTMDGAIRPQDLQQCLQYAVERTFNRLTVDGDTSTNDMVLALASGVGHAIPATEEALGDLAQVLEYVCGALARECAQDGEGATKLVEVTVRGARTEGDAARIARAIAESLLVKTALFGCDPNWGRILAAAGRCGVAFDPQSVDLVLGNVQVCRNGYGADFDRDQAKAALHQPEVRLELNIHQGTASATFWTCDLSYDYVRINAEYHT
ncbi:MAG: bifunctional glutamate N-acetyltransferase/amino-acid acetyltransferase ArgJ [Chthonomonadales bacterium]